MLGRSPSASRPSAKPILVSSGVGGRQPSRTSAARTFRLACTWNAWLPGGDRRDGVPDAVGRVAEVDDADLLTRTRRRASPPMRCGLAGQCGRAEERRLAAATSGTVRERFTFLPLVGWSWRLDEACRATTIYRRHGSGGHVEEQLRMPLPARRSDIAASISPSGRCAVTELTEGRGGPSAERDQARNLAQRSCSYRACSRATSSR